MTQFLQIIASLTSRKDAWRADDIRTFAELCDEQELADLADDLEFERRQQAAWQDYA